MKKKEKRKGKGEKRGKGGEGQTHQTKILATALLIFTI